MSAVDEAAPEELQRELNEDVIMAASSPAGFAFVATRDDAMPYIPDKFHLEIAKGLVDIEQGRLELLVIQCPVQHGKSTTASVWGQAWEFGVHPNWRVIGATYNTDFAEDNLGKPTRDILERHGPAFFGVHVDPTSRSMKRWGTTAGGRMVAVGVDKPVTGRPADKILIDDPYPGLAEAMSRNFRAEIEDWFKANVISRRAAKLRLVVIMSRWNEDDFVAFVLRMAEEGGWKYKVLDFPAIAICPIEGCNAPKLTVVDGAGPGELELVIEPCDHGVRDSLGRLPGEALWPRVRPIEFLKKQYIAMGGPLFDSLYQGRPRKAGGTIFKQEWYRYFTLTDGIVTLRNNAGVGIQQYRVSECICFQIVDLASGDTQTLRSGVTRAKKADYFVVGTFLLCPRNELLVWNIFRDNRIDGTAQLPLLGQLKSKYGSGRIGIEAVAYQWTAVQQAVAAGLPAVPIVRGNESKETRAWAIAARYETGQVYHLQGAPWIDALESELLAFPRGANDDQVDVLSDAGAVVAERLGTSKPNGVRV